MSTPVSYTHLGSGIKNDITYWGANVYGVWNTEYANVIGNVGYLQSKNKISHAGYKGKPDVKTFSVGVRVEKPLACLLYTSTG